MAMAGNERWCMPYRLLEGVELCTDFGAQGAAVQLTEVAGDDPVQCRAA